MINQKLVFLINFLIGINYCLFVKTQKLLVRNLVVIYSKANFISEGCLVGLSELYPTFLLPVFSSDFIDCISGPFFRATAAAAAAAVAAAAADKLTAAAVSGAHCFKSKCVLCQTNSAIVSSPDALYG